jgi:NAD(P)-dependent dehydrogenase (short-subunit alcohol dehydrogenase family)
MIMGAGHLGFSLMIYVITNHGGIKMRLEGKIALVTGGSSGIGRATALAFAGEGAKVVIGDIQVEGGERTLQAIKEAGGDAILVKTDVTRPDQVEALINRAVETYGQLDCAFNNAGFEGTRAPTADYAEEDWDRVISINLKGVWLCMKYEIPHMLKQGGGAIVNTASSAGLVGFRTAPAYTAAKHGIVGLTKTAALDYAPAGIRINAVCPGVVRTPMLERLTGGHAKLEAWLLAQEPVGRAGTPEEIAEAVVWLCSDAASFVTGHPMAVDGGLVVP